MDKTLDPTAPKSNAPTGSLDRDTRGRLLQGAATEFNSIGYHATNTNKIAKAAGFAPQTFYRHFDDKIDAFLATYEFWQAAERAAIARAAKADASVNAMVRTVLAHHVEWKIFRRSLRLLAVEEPKVRSARTASRNRQIDALMAVPGNKARSRDLVAADLLHIERLSDAAADNELRDLGITPSGIETMLARAIRRARGEREGDGDEAKQV